jgi:hypothetical protein
MLAIGQTNTSGSIRLIDNLDGDFHQLLEELQHSLILFWKENASNPRKSLTMCWQHSERFVAKKEEITLQKKLDQVKKITSLQFYSVSDTTHLGVGGRHLMMQITIIINWAVMETGWRQYRSNYSWDCWNLDGTRCIQHRVGDSPPPKWQTRQHVAPHVGVLAPTCRRHQAMSAPQMPCQCPVGMTITQHVGDAMALGEVCWAAIEGSGGAGLRRQRQKMSNKGVNVNVVQREGRSTLWDK